MEPSAPAKADPSYFDMTAEERLQALLTLEANHREQLIQWQIMRDMRDAAEDRFVKMRDQHDELEQEMADLRQELLREKAMNSDANVRKASAITIRPLWTRILDYWRQ